MNNDPSHATESALVDLLRKLGFFVALEGGEGTGKTTLAKWLLAALVDLGHDVTLTREPGGITERSPLAMELRKLLLGKLAKTLTPIGELLLMLAARDAHLGEVVRPDLALGKVVVCDRFFASTFAYQLRGRQDKMDARTLVRAEDFFYATQRMYQPHPDLYIWLDAPVDVALARVLPERSASAPVDSGQTLTHFDLEEGAFHQRVRDGFAEYFKTSLVPHVRIDATLPPEEVATRALAAIGCAMRDKVAGIITVAKELASAPP